MKRAIELEAQGKCIECQEPREGRRRGLCVKHYEQFQRKKKSLPEDEQAEWDTFAVRQGRILASRQGNRATEDDAFADLFEQFREQMHQSSSAKDAVEAFEAVAKKRQAEYQRKQAAKKKTSGRRKKQG